MPLLFFLFFIIIYLLSAFKRYANYDKLLLNSRKRALEIDFEAQRDKRQCCSRAGRAGSKGGGEGRTESQRSAANSIKPLEKKIN